MCYCRGYKNLWKVACNKNVKKNVTHTFLPSVRFFFMYYVTRLGTVFFIPTFMTRPLKFIKENNSFFLQLFEQLHTYYIIIKFNCLNKNCFISSMVNKTIRKILLSVNSQVIEITKGCFRKRYPPFLTKRNNFKNYGNW